MDRSIQRFGEEVSVERLERALGHTVASCQLIEERHGLLQAIDTPDWALFKADLACFHFHWGEQRELQLETVEGGKLPSPLVCHEKLDLPPSWPSPFPGTAIYASLRLLLEGEEVAPRWQAQLEEQTYRLIRHSGEPLFLQLHSYHALPAESWKTFSSFRLSSPEESADLAEIADDLSKALGWEAEETGLLLFAEEEGAFSAPHPRWEGLPDDSQDQLFDLVYKVLRQQTGQLLWHEPGARLGIDPERLHAMRVATRRLRAALRLFLEVLPARTATHLRGELKWLGASLGRVRDLDVYLERLEGLEFALLPESRPGLEQYRRRLIEEREKRREGLLRALRTRRFLALKESLAAMMEKRPMNWRNRRAMTQPALSAAAVFLAPPLNRLLKAGRALRLDSPDVEMHALRIRIKRLRYALEFFQRSLDSKEHAAGVSLPAASSKPANSLSLGAASNRWIIRLRKLQDILGEHQDLVVGQETIRGFLQKTGGGQEGRQYAFVLGQASALHAQRALECRRAFFEAWKNLDRKKLRQPLKKALKRAGEGTAGQGSP
ncbi:MAG: CHAD domain-containing protein [bacterium]